VTGWRTSALLATLALVVVTAIWGSTFAVVKEAIEPDGPMSVAGFLTWRFAVAAVVMAALRPRSVAALGPVGRRHGVLAGVALGIGYVTQTYGLQSTPAGVSGFITGMFVVFTPLVSALVVRRRVASPAWVAVVLATGGLALLSIGSTGDQHGTPLGVLLTVACALAFAVHIVTLGEWSHRHDAIGLAVMQLATVTVVSAIASAFGGSGLAPPPTGGAWGAIALTALAATAFAFFVQTWAQTILDPTRTAVIMTMEPVFAGVFGVVLAGETFGPRTAAGAVLVLGAMLLVEVGPRRGGREQVRRLEV
jgi:drug/metabolite transporter (DMT)-like permease